ncbi:MAG: hypothetical protein ACO1QB_04815 [Verrucomicrobiales bacterium]
MKCRRGRTVYFVSAGLAVIPISVSQLEHELLPMAGLLHVFMSGLYPLGLFALLHLYRTKRKPLEPPSKEDL